MVYVPNTYFAVGNDGNHFNSSINSGTNYSVSSTVLSALYSLSDHLPVIADFDLDMQGLSTEEFKIPALPNPMRQPFEFGGYTNNYSLILVGMDGQVVFRKAVNEHKILQQLPTGVYTALWTKKGFTKASKLMVW